jgi:hypothetical protein
MWNLRPVDDQGERVPPSELELYRQDHEFLLPCCLCAYSDAKYTECAVYLMLGGPLTGTYVAVCAKSKCGYLGTYTLNNTILIVYADSCLFFL